MPKKTDLLASPMTLLQPAEGPYGFCYEFCLMLFNSLPNHGFEILMQKLFKWPELKNGTLSCVRGNVIDGIYDD